MKIASLDMAIISLEVQTILFIKYLACSDVMAYIWARF